MLLPWLLLVRQARTIHNRGGMGYLNNFGFDSRGRYNVTFNHVKGARVVFALCSTSEYDFLSPVKSLCTLRPMYHPDILDTGKVVNGTVHFSGTVPSRGIHYPMFSVCDGEDSRYRVDAQFSNVGSRLDTRVAPCLVTDPVWLAIFIAGELVWLFNWTVNHKVRNSLHAYFTAASMLAVAYLLLHWLSVRHHRFSDAPCLLDALLLLTKTSMATVIFAMVAMLACGLCVIRIEMPLSQVLHCFWVSALVTVPTFWLHVWENATDLFRMERMVIAFGLRAYFVMHYIRLFTSTVETFFEEHKVIEPDELGELAKEFKRFRLHYNYMFWWVTGLFCIWTMDELRMNVYWMSSCFQNVIIALLLCECGWVCRLQSLALVLEAETLENRNGIRWEKMRMECLPK